MGTWCWSANYFLMFNQKSQFVSLIYITRKSLELYNYITFSCLTRISIYISHLYHKKIARAATLKCTLKYCVYQTRASRLNTGTVSANGLANALLRCVHLSVLSVSHNPDIGDEAAANIVTSLLQRKVSSHLSVLKLCCVSASRKTANAIAEMLTRTAEFSTLEDLDLRNNRIDCIGASSIASSLSSIKSSSRLRVRLDANQIEDRGAASLLSALKFRPKSLQITLSQNETTSPILRSSFMMASKRSSAFHRTTATTPSFVLPEI
mgnify:CR=1 FL=1